jgi:hypothetical protein
MSDKWSRSEKLDAANLAAASLIYFKTHEISNQLSVVQEHTKFQSAHAEFQSTQIEHQSQLIESQTNLLYQIESERKQEKEIKHLVYLIKKEEEVINGLNSNFEKFILTHAYLNTINSYGFSDQDLSEIEDKIFYNNCLKSLVKNTEYEFHPEERKLYRQILILIKTFNSLNSDFTEVLYVEGRHTEEVDEVGFIDVEESSFIEYILFLISKTFFRNREIVELSAINQKFINRKEKILKKIESYTSLELSITNYKEKVKYWIQDITSDILNIYPNLLPLFLMSEDINMYLEIDTENLSGQSGAKKDTTSDRKTHTEKNNIGLEQSKQMTESEPEPYKGNKIRRVTGGYEVAGKTGKIFKTERATKAYVDLEQSKQVTESEPELYKGYKIGLVTGGYEVEGKVGKVFKTERAAKAYVDLILAT